jgi:hypothetical protein
LTRTTRPDVTGVPTFSNRKIFAIFFVLTAVLLIDVTIGSTQDILLDFAISPAGFALFIIIAAISIFAQFYIIRMVKATNKQNDSSKRHHFGRFEIATIGVQSVLGAIMIFIILQIIFVSQYYTDLLAVANTISYGLVICLLSLLTYKFFSWFRIYKSLTILLYGIASALIAINALDTIVLFNISIIEKPDIVTIESEVIYKQPEEGTVMAMALSVMSTTQTAYFLLIWGATVIVLYHNIKRLGKIRFWALVVPPILFFMSFYITFYETILPPEVGQEPPSIVYILLVIYSMIAAGIFFGIGFLSIARSPNLQGQIRDYMFIAGYAFVLFIVSSISIIDQAGYPPFGLAGVSTVGLASFLILTGLYNSAVAVSQDVQLRRTIKSSAKEELKLIDNIGSAEMHREIEKKVIYVAKLNADILAEKSGVEPSMNDQEIIEYLHLATEELKKKEEEKQGDMA